MNKKRVIYYVYIYKCNFESRHRLFIKKMNKIINQAIELEVRYTIATSLAKTYVEKRRMNGCDEFCETLNS